MLKSKTIRSYKQYLNEIDKLKNLYPNFNFYYRGDTLSPSDQPRLFSNNNTKLESKFFRLWQKHERFVEDTKEGYRTDDFVSLATMQHYATGTNKLLSTRLLDFTTDENVALQFACGYPENKKDKRTITVVCTNDKEITDVSNEVISVFMKYICCENQEDIVNTYFENEEILSKDYFVNLKSNESFDILYTERIRRQSGCFLLFGENKKVPYKEKGIHQLSNDSLRGRNYMGCFKRI